MPRTERTSFAQEITSGIARFADWTREQMAELSDSRVAEAFDVLRPAWIRLTYAGLRAAEKIIDRFPVIEDLARMALDASPRIFASPQAPVSEMTASDDILPMGRTPSLEELVINPIEVSPSPYCQSAELLRRQVRVLEQRPAMVIRCCVP